MRNLLGPPSSSRIVGFSLTFSMRAGNRRELDPLWQGYGVDIMLIIVGHALSARLVRVFT